MTRPTPKRRSPARSTARGGFTLIEILMVIIIIGILVALLLPAIAAAMRAARKAAVTSEINLLSQTLTQFKSTYGDYPPSRFLAVESGNYTSYLSDTTTLSGGTLTDPYSPGNGDITLGQLAQRSVAAIRKFWPRVNTATGNAATVLTYDFNGNGTADGAYVLHGHECLVFFLGGIPTQDANGNFGMIGFDKNPTNPFTNNAYVAGVQSSLYSTNRQPPIFEFNTTRLFADPTSPTGIPGYYDTLGNALPGNGNTLNYYAYFSSYGNGGYDPNDVNFAFETDSALNGPIGLNFLTAFSVYTPVNDCSSWSPNPYTTTLTNTAPVTFQRAQTFQIISSGIDGLYGVGGQYLANTATSATQQLPIDTTNTFYGATTGTSLSAETDPLIRKREQDNLTNITSGSLQ